MRGSIAFALSKGNPFKMLAVGRAFGPRPAQEPEAAAEPEYFDSAKESRRQEAAEIAEEVRKSATGRQAPALLDTGLDALGIGEVIKSDGPPQFLDPGNGRRFEAASPDVQVTKADELDPAKDHWTRGELQKLSAGLDLVRAGTHAIDIEVADGRRVAHFYPKPQAAKSTGAALAGAARELVTAAVGHRQASRARAVEATKAPAISKEESRRHFDEVLRKLGGRHAVEKSEVPRSQPTRPKVRVLPLE